jgi:hypothetical protein
LRAKVFITYDQLFIQRMDDIFPNITILLLRDFYEPSSRIEVA